MLGKLFSAGRAGALLAFDVPRALVIFGDDRPGLAGCLGVLQARAGALRRMGQFPLDEAGLLVECRASDIVAKYRFERGLPVRMPLRKAEGEAAVADRIAALAAVMADLDAEIEARGTEPPNRGRWVRRRAEPEI